MQNNLAISQMGDNYLSVKLMLPEGGVMVKGHVTAQKKRPGLQPH
jgi:hypothetical protein